MDSSFDHKLDLACQTSLERDNGQRMKYLKEEYRQFFRDAEPGQTVDQTVGQIFFREVGRKPEEQSAVEKVEVEAEKEVEKAHD